MIISNELCASIERDYNTQLRTDEDWQNHAKQLGFPYKIIKMIVESSPEGLDRIIGELDEMSRSRQN